MPSLSIVVPVYNVLDYLIPCLESLVAQTLKGLEVVLVDDGSTDGSGAAADEFANGREGWTVLHVENGGLGRARNIGMDHSTSDYVAFVDSDDLIPRDAYELMLHAVSQSGSDIVSGGVLRFDGARTFASPLHRRAIKATQMRTHIRRTPDLMYDTTAWNKIYRREFLHGHGLRFPEGVYYEDIPLTLPAHFLASSVDVIEDPVYLWRERQTAEQSITQRRAEAKNVIDRMAAVSTVDDFLADLGDETSKRLHDHKVLTIDIPLFLNVLHEGDDTFRAEVVRLAKAYLERVRPQTLERLIPLRRLQYHLISRDKLTELMELHDFLRVPENRGRFVRSKLRMFADLPFRGDPKVGVPSSVYEVTRSQPLRTGIRDVLWRDGDLIIDGHAFIHRVSEPTRLSSVRRFQLREIGAASAMRKPLKGRRVHRPDLTARTTGDVVSYDAAGFETTIGGGDLALAPGVREAQFELLVQVAARSARRGSSVGNPERGRALHPRRAFLPTGELVVPAYKGRSLAICVRRVDAVVESVREHGESITFTLKATAGIDLTGRALFLRRTDALRALLVPLEVDGRVARASVSADQLEIRASSLGDREWVLGLGLPDQDPESEPHAPLDLAPETEDQYLAMGQRSVAIRQDGARGALITESRPGLVLTDFEWLPEGLRLTGDVLGGEVSHLLLSTSAGGQHELPVDVVGDRWSVLVPARGEPGSPVLRWLKPGRWHWALATGDQGQRERAVMVSSQAEYRLGESGSVDGLSLLLRSSGHHDLQMIVDGSGDYLDRGALRRERARRYHYRVQRRMPLEDVILFEAWRGKQYSDSPRAIHEELQRHGDQRSRVWAVVDHGVEVPEHVETVLVGSRAYYRHLARARWVVSNDSMPAHYVKREGTRYAQTWHGTPLKRIGFDIENLQMSNKKYLVQFAREVRKWDALVSPNRFSTEILGRAFGYEGEVLEIGYPRNDVFHQEEERAERAAKLLRRLGLDEGKRVILYAPTWRDNVYNASGRYLFPMKLDLERMYRAFGNDSVLLIRGHQLVASAIDSSMFGGFARNVSDYPDISDLYLLADVLITDYSSVMFDFVNTGRPMLFFTYDLEAYRDDLRGFYFDFETEAPGPLLPDTSAVIAALSDLEAVQATYAERYQVFRTKFAGLEDGRASARFIEAFLGDR